MTDTAVGQGKKSLDSDFGIAKFKLETPYSLYKADLEYFDTDKQGIEYYIYQKDVKEIFGLPVEQIGLGFYENKLYTISIGFGVLDKTQNLALLHHLKDKYDIPQITEPNNNERVWVAEWVTGKTYLQATEYNCLSSINRCKTEVFIYSKSIKRQLPSD